MYSEREGDAGEKKVKKQKERLQVMVAELDNAMPYMLPKNDTP